MTGASETNTALLVQLLDQMGTAREELGSIKTQLEHGSRRFDDLDVKVEAISTKQTAIEATLTPVAGLEPRVKTIESFMGKKLAPIVAVSSAFIAVILWILAITLGAAGSWIKTWVSTHIH